MKKAGTLNKFFFLTEGCLLPSVFIFSMACADTVTLKNGKELKGLVVENHADRIIMSTESGEIPILRTGVKNILYADPEQNFFKVGKSYEAQNKLGEALAYYEKALEINPNYDEAKKAALGVRNRFWALSVEGARGEVEKKQMIYDSWQKGVPSDETLERRRLEQASSLRGGLGVDLEKKGDWIVISGLESKKDAAVSGLKKGDRLIAIDGDSLRYLNPEAVTLKLLLPRYASFILEFERDCFLPEGFAGNLKTMGLTLKLRYEGLRIESIKPGSPASEAGLREEDLLIQINGESTRYMPLRQVNDIVRKSKDKMLVLAVRRAASLTRR